MEIIYFFVNICLLILFFNLLLFTNKNQRQSQLDYFQDARYAVCMIKHMRNEQARIGFLSAVLNLNPSDILETKLFQRGRKSLLPFPHSRRLTEHLIHR